MTTIVSDVRDPLHWPEASMDAVYSHMLFNMALSTLQLERLSGRDSLRAAPRRIARVHRPPHRRCSLPSRYRARRHHDRKRRIHRRLSPARTHEQQQDTLALRVDLSGRRVHELHSSGSQAVGGGRGCSATLRSAVVVSPQCCWFANKSFPRSHWFEHPLLSTYECR